MYGMSTAKWRSLFKYLMTGNKPRARRNASIASRAADVETLEPRRLLTVTFHGGAVLANVEAQNVFLGSDWQTTSSLQTQKTTLDQYTSMLVSSAFMDMLSNAGYGVNRGTATAGVVDNISLNKTTGITDASIQQNLQAMINAGQLQTPDANRLYIVYVEPNVLINLNGATSANTFLGYHGAFGGKTKAGANADIHYAVIAYPGGPNPTASSQGFSSIQDELTAVASHEIAEAVTDPNVNYKSLSWYDDNLNGEVGDLTRVTVSFNGFLVQEIVNKNDQAMNPNNTTSTTFGAPKNVVLTPTSKTTATLTWNGVANTQGFKVFRVDGSRTTLVGTVGATTTSFQLTGLTAGSTVSFKVEAYTGTTVADSAVVTATMPTTNLAGPVLSAHQLTSSTEQLTWTAVTGTQGYRVYWSDGTNRYLLGSVAAGVTSVQIVGLSPSSTYKFQVEAFQGTLSQASNWVTVTTASNSHAGHNGHSSTAPAGIIVAGVNRKNRLDW